MPRDPSRLVAVLLLMCAAAATASGQPVAPELLDKARAQGEVRVIVQLRVANPGDPATITAAQDAVLAELGGTRFRLIRRYRTLASLALAVGEDALRVLMASPHVESVGEDQKLAPLTPSRPPTR